ncbi:trypsin-like peptidase domain-containing protein [Nostoc sphaeroides CHAB 2801]|uniref:trypsin-like serine peptidase n=1 Tax=Nostoc sphaeroides TaxID=446679 RepID=UPI000E4793DA|nr:trypsin-like peptidase domain-containing protein [Nostoc sphaeroides]MCC5629841.1 trypsin-like peptidase domain-containing protein [Nostoc sphaeroides CHAB 2801]
MTKKPIYKQTLALFFALFIAGMLGFTTLGGWVSVQAKEQTQTAESKPPKFTKFEDANQLQLSGDGKPFKPSGLNQSEKPYEKDRAIIDWDDRIPMISREYPWSTIGRVQGTTSDARSYHCTGTLIYENLVLTNSHCVIDPKTQQLSKKILFLPNLINGVVPSKNDIAFVEQVIYGTDFTTNDRIKNQINDWAVMKINKPLGRKYGYLGWDSLPSSTLIKNKKKFFFVGYSGDFPNTEKKGYEFLSAGRGMTASFQEGCSIVQEQQEVLLHDCDTKGGSSGGPIIGLVGGEPYIMALNNAEITDAATNRGIINLAVKIDFLDRLFAKN